MGSRPEDILVHSAYPCLPCCLIRGANDQGKEDVDDKEEPLIRPDEELPWSDIQHLVDSGAINPPMDGEEIFLSSLLAVCDDTRKLYHPKKDTLSTFGTKLVSYAFDQYKQGV
ncbi:hypothetical protein [Ralstonia sp. PR5]|uniref:hypothetical protein n=1 Tax=Ralstonia sp. PR5 TaxID=3448079 RepID=UPI00402BBB7B